jgi:Uncharacterized protein conserved in bacteria (DUF2252)
MPPDNQWPPPGEKGAARDEGNEEQMDDHHNVSANPVPHFVTCQDNRSIPKMGPRTRSARATLPGPWEWDVKRLAASLEVFGA